MNQDERIEFVRQLVNSVKDDVIADITRNPELVKDWDGLELRWYLKDKFAECVLSGMVSERRKKEYNNKLLLFA